MTQHLRQKQALIDFEAFFVFLLARAVGQHLRSCGDQPRHALGGEKDEVFDAHELAPLVGELALECSGVAAQEGNAHLAQVLDQRVGRDLFVG